MCFRFSILSPLSALSSRAVGGSEPHRVPFGPASTSDRPLRSPPPPSLPLSYRSTQPPLTTTANTSRAHRRPSPMPPDRPRGDRPPSYAAPTESQRRKARGAVGDPPADANAGPSRSAPSTGSPTSIYSRPKKVVPYSSPTGPRLGTTIKVRNLTLARHTGAANSHHQKGQTEELVMGLKPVGHVPKSNKPTGMFEMAPLSVPAKVLPPGAREAAQQLVSTSSPPFRQAVGLPCSRDRR